MPDKVVFPLVASFDADGTAQLNQVMQETVTARAADYDLYIQDGSANGLFSAFVLAEGPSDTSADIQVTTANGAAVTAAIKHALENATGGANALNATGGQALKALLESYVKTQVESDLATSGLYNILEAEGLLNVVIPNATIGDAGSAAMWTAIDTAPAAVKAVMATQLPYEKYSTLQDGGNLNGIFAAGDEIVLQFTVSSTLNVTPQKEDVTGAQGADAGVAAQAAFDADPKIRTFNLHVIKA